MKSPKNNVSATGVKATAQEEMLILAPAHELDQPFKGWKVAALQISRCRSFPGADRDRANALRHGVH